MLIKLQDLKRIKAGEISFLFRRWKSPRVKKDSIIHSPVGQLKIIDIQEISPNDILPKIIKKSGRLAHEVKKEVSNTEKGQLFLISIEFHGEDPRISLRNDTNLSEGELQSILDKLNSYDKRSKQGAWTENIMKIIKANPKERAETLAGLLKFDKKWDKNNVRKLKSLGLTISHDTGYTIAPRGRMVLKRITDGK